MLLSDLHHLESLFGRTDAALGLPDMVRHYGTDAVSQAVCDGYLELRASRPLCRRRPDGTCPSLICCLTDKGRQAASIPSVPAA